MYSLLIDLTSHAIPNVRGFVEIFTLKNHAVPLKVPWQRQTRGAPSEATLRMEEPFSS
jgi:hypothetical protein